MQKELVLSQRVTARTGCELAKNRSNGARNISGQTITQVLNKPPDKTNLFGGENKDKR